MCIHRRIRRALPWIVFGSVLGLLIGGLEVSKESLLIVFGLSWIVLAIYLFREVARYNSFETVVTDLKYRLISNEYTYRKHLEMIISEIKIGDDHTLSNLWLRRSRVGSFLCEGGLYWKVGLNDLASDFTRFIEQVSEDEKASHVEWILVKYITYSCGITERYSLRSSVHFTIPLKGTDDFQELLDTLNDLTLMSVQRRDLALAKDFQQYMQDLQRTADKHDSESLDCLFCHVSDQIVRIVQET